MNESPSHDADVLNKVLNTKDFLERALIGDDLDDWGLARSLGEFLIRVDPSVLLGHVILARAHRHLGDPLLAADELRRCRAIIAGGDPETDLVATVEAEARALAALG